MNGKTIYDAMEYISQDLIMQAETQHFSRPLWQTILPAAAMLAMLFGVGTILLPAENESVSVPPKVQQVMTEVPLQETEPSVPKKNPEPDNAHPLDAIFPQVDPHSLLAYTQTHPEALADGWEALCIKETDTENPTTGILTRHGDPVLALDAQNGILLVQVRGADYRGILAIANDPKRLSLQTSSQLGISGETIGTISEAHNGILSINGCRLLSDDNGSGAQIAGYAMCSGVEYNREALTQSGLTRLEIDADGQFHLMDPHEPVSSETCNSLETPFPMIIDGTLVEQETGIHPRSCIGQTESGAVAMLVIEGRMPDYSIGTTVMECAAILQRYGCVNAVHLDSGTSAILWYDGQYVTRCSNSQLMEGRLLPTAFVVERITETGDPIIRQ